MFDIKKLVLAIAVLGVSSLALAQSQSLIETGKDFADASLEGFSQGPALTTVSVGVDYSEGKYGEPVKSRTTTVPLVIKHETGPFTFKANIPWVTATGTRSGGGDRATLIKQTESGLGDVTLSGFYTAYTNNTAMFGIDIGGKIKFATADKSKTLLTTGENDYSLQGDVYKSFGPTTLFGTLGWTKKGDPDFVDFRDPWYTTLGVSYRVGAATALGASYDYRQKVTSRGDPVSEASLFLTHKFTKQLKMQAYLVGGFSDASPDFGAGAVISAGF